MSGEPTTETGRELLAYWADEFEFPNERVRDTFLLYSRLRIAASEAEARKDGFGAAMDQGVLHYGPVIAAEKAKVARLERIEVAARHLTNLYAEGWSHDSEQEAWAALHEALAETADTAEAAE